MSLLDGSLSALFGAAFSSLFRDAILAKLATTDDGSGGFVTSLTTYPGQSHGGGRVGPGRARRAACLTSP